MNLCIPKNYWDCSKPFHTCYSSFVPFPPPLQIHIEVLTPNTSECGLIWRWVLYKGNQVEISSLGWALFQQDWCPYKGRFGHTHIQRDAMWRYRDNKVIHKPRRGTWDTPFVHGPQKEPTWLTPWLWTYSLQNCETVTFCCLSHTVHGILLWQL